MEEKSNLLGFVAALLAGVLLAGALGATAFLRIQQRERRAQEEKQALAEAEATSREYLRRAAEQAQERSRLSQFAK